MLRPLPTRLTASALGLLALTAVAGPARGLDAEAISQLCRYDGSTAGSHRTLLQCDPLAKHTIQLAGFDYALPLGYAFRGDRAQPSGTVPICEYEHASKGRLTTTWCDPGLILGRYGSGWTPVGANGGRIGWAYWAGLTQPDGATDFCEYVHSSGRYLATTQCSDAPRTQLELDGYTYRDVLGFVFAPNPTPPWAAGLQQIETGSISATIHPSSEQDRALWAQIFSYPSEIAPIVVAEDENIRHYLLSSAWTWRCKSKENLLVDPVQMDDEECSVVTRSEHLDSIDKTGAWFLEQTLPFTLDNYWKRTYNGALRAHVVGVGPDRKVIGIMHGENQNYGNDGEYAPECDTAPTCVRTNVGDVSVALAAPAAGYQGMTYLPSWASFRAFANLGYVPFAGGWSSTQSFIDLGPVIWPDHLYVTATGGGGGPYHPTSFVNDNSFFAYYLDVPSTPSIPQCIAAARAPLAPGTLPGPLLVYNETTTPTYSNPSLPTGFNVDPNSNFFSHLGGASTCLIKDGKIALYFNVARLRGTPYFISAHHRTHSYTAAELAEDGLEGIGWHEQIVLRLSTDPGNWDLAPAYLVEDRYVPGSTLPWGNLKFTYPIFYDKEGLTNDEVDPDDFYLVGNNPLGNAYTSADPFRPAAKRLCIAIGGSTCDS